MKRATIDIPPKSPELQKDVDEFRAAQAVKWQKEKVEDRKKALKFFKREEEKRMKAMTDEEYKVWEKDYLEKEKKYQVEARVALQNEGGKEDE